MMNWIYTWYKPRVDPTADPLAEYMATLFLQGVQAWADRSGRNGRVRNGRGRPVAG